MFNKILKPSTALITNAIKLEKEKYSYQNYLMNCMLAPETYFEKPQSTSKLKDKNQKKGIPVILFLAFTQPRKKT